jgi:hypothetical protein
MKINPPGMPPDSPRGAADGVGRQINSFPARSVEREPAAGASQAAPAGVAGRYTKADLADPKTLESIVLQAIEEMIEAEPGAAARLSAAEKRHVAEFMAGDPAMRRQIERWLEKVLK